ncbi:hypothetical protein BGZ58_001793 [Dissophora ornata]|nr:hypothetical protein BGZ58_001793 [Dissophora ornata]
MATRSARTADKTTNDKHARILKALLQKPENKYCVDCRKKVKSVDLDSWTAVQVENMIKWGNEKANLYWESRLPESSIPNENTSGIDPWIRSKYEWKQFTTKGPVPDPSELGPVDEAMLMELHGRSDGNSRSRGHGERSSEPGSFGIIAPPPSNPTRSSFLKRPTSASAVQGADLFSISQQRSASAVTPAQEDFFGLNEPASPASPALQTQAKRASIQSPQAQQPTQNSATQDLFSLVAPAPSGGQPAPGAAAGTPTTAQGQGQAKAGNADWKNSIMSLYGNSPSGAGNRNSGSFNMGMQQQQGAQFGQLQGMSAFGFGQQQQQQQQQQQPQQQQQSLWGNDDGFGSMQQASSSPSSSFDAFSMGSNAGFGTQTNNGFNRPASANNNTNRNSVPQGGDLFNIIAGTTQSPVTSPPPQNKNNSAFGDLTWN